MPKRELSTKPSQVRNRMRRKLADIQAEIYRIKPLEEWDWEELQRGYPRHSNGRFGRPPAWAGFHIVAPEVQKRLAQMTAANLRTHSQSALQAIVDMITSDEVDIEGNPIVKPETKLKAAQFIIEHTIGKPQTNVNVDAGDSLKSLLAKVMVNDDGEDAHPITIPGVVEYDEYDDEEEE